MPRGGPKRSELGESLRRAPATRLRQVQRLERFTGAGTNGEGASTRRLQLRGSGW